jgi:hypothetical protein
LARTISAPPDEAISLVHQIYVALVVPAELTPDPASRRRQRARRSPASRYWSGQRGDDIWFTTAQVLPVYRSAFGCTDGPQAAF